MKIDIQTDRPVNAIQALAASRAAVADALAEHLIGVLKKRFLGTKETSSTFTTDLRNGRLDRYDVHESAPPFPFLLVNMCKVVILRPE
jgi:hypothetical protein